MKKYNLTDETIEVNGVKLHRIVAVVSFSNVKKGELGGYVESEANLSQDGDACVSGDAWVESVRDVFVCYNAISSGRSITYTRNNKMWTTGCFSGTGNELIAKAYNDSKKKGEWFEKLVQFVENL